MKIDNYQKVTDNFINPLSKIFSKSLNDEMTAAYVEDLGEYSPKELDRAVLSIRRSLKYFPVIASAIEHCDDARRQMNYRPKADNQNSVLPSAEREERARVLVAEYLHSFKYSSGYYSEALSGGWSRDLLEFVEAVAWIQAQRIVGQKSIGWNGGKIFGYGKSVSPEEARVFLDEQYRQADSGSIDVGIPTGRIEDFKKNPSKIAV